MASSYYGATPSPQKRRQLILSRSTSSRSRIELSRIRFHPSNAEEEPIMLHSMHNDASGQPSDSPTVPIFIQQATTAYRMLAMAQETHAHRLALEDKAASESGTQTAYARHLKNYETWWEGDQTRRLAKERLVDISAEYIPAHPITATKVAMFLNFEATRPKRSGVDGDNLSGMRVGPSSIKQCISALEYYRSHLAHREDYASNPDSQRQLRNDIRIKTYERCAKASEPERMEKMQMTKINGVKTDTFGSVEELTKASMHYLESPEASTPYKIHLGIRDRAMFVLPTAMAFRGDNTRGIYLNDVFLRDIPLVDISLTFKAKALVIFSDQGKENKQGRHDNQGAFRHRIVENCAIGALALYFFSMFHIAEIDKPVFEPDYNRSEYDGFGFRAWYTSYLFPGQDGDKMTYANHRKQITKMKKKTNLDFKKVTHAGRPWAVEQAALYGAPKDSRAALGGWQLGDSMPACYDRALPTDAMLGAAGFNARKQTSFFIARDVLDPPDDLIEEIFPWIEDERRALDLRIQIHGRHGRDNSLVLFLDLLTFLRVVLLQDTAVLFSRYPNCPVFSLPPFNTPSFQRFSSTSVNIISAAEEENRHKLDLLPEDVASTFRAAMMTNSINQERDRLEREAQHARLEERIEMIQNITKASLLAGATGKKRKAYEASLQMLESARPSPAPPRDRASTSNTSLPTQFSRTNSKETTSSDQHTMSPILPALPNPAPTASQTLSHPIEPEINVSPPQSSISCTRTVISHAGNIYPFPTFELSSIPECCERQHHALSSLEAVFPVDRLLKHQFDWDDKTSTWLPKFEFWKPKSKILTVDDIWREDRFGIDGLFSIQELNAQWDARWKRNIHAVKQEAYRRKKVVDLIDLLSRKPNWNSTIALRFLHDVYPVPMKSGRAFSDYLTKVHVDQIMEASNAYIK